MIKIGIIGAGPNAAGHARYHSESDRAKVVWVADPDSVRASSLAAECSARSLSDFACGLDEVDAVVVSSPNFLHRDHAVACASAGKHVFCEKPLGLSLKEAREIADAVAAADVRSQVGFSVRFTAEVQTMIRHAHSGELGSLVAIASRRLMHIADEGHGGWRSDHALSGGLLLEINIHEIEWMMAAGGKVDSVFARAWSHRASESRPPRDNDHVWVTLGFESGATGSHEGSWWSPNPQYYRSISGTEGGLSTDEWGGTLFSARLGKDRVVIPSGQPFNLRANFLDAIETGAGTVADAAWGLEVMTVAEAIFESAATGQVVTVEHGVAK
ncbi:MAG TPA: Gfo/Idh/MocA family oxidoreductase [Capsulimonadaceae bacterium]|jgi:predicted dehydrogenase